MIFTCINVHAVVDYTFTYQGELIDAGSPAQGTYDIVIQAFNDAGGSGGSLADSFHDDVEVNAGLFTIEQVDLGSSVFDGLDVWLRIAVKKPAENTYIALSPLQKMKSVPYANSLIDKGATDGQVLTFDVINGWEPSTPSGGTNLIRVSDSAVLGKVIGVSFGTKEWTIINNNGFIVHVNADGVPKIESALYNDGSCTTDPLYLQFATNSNATGSIVASQGLVFTIQDIGTYYVAQNTTLIDNAAYNRRRNSPTNCQSQTIPVNTVIPLLINSEAVTGVPDGGYGPVTIQ